MTNELPSEIALFEHFLREHPAIFTQYPEFLDHLNLSDSRGVTSLLERKVQRLEDALLHMRTQHSELVDVANENQSILTKLDETLARLLVYRNLSEFYTDFPRVLRDAFLIDQVSLKTPALVATKPSDKLQYKEVMRRLSGKSAVCDNRWPSALTGFLFSAPTASAALVPLLASSQTEVIGVLALGSNDPERYAPDLGAAHLNRIGLLAGLCLSRLSLDAA